MPMSPDSTQIETRLSVLAELLDQAVTEVRRTISEIKGGTAAADPPPAIAISPPAVVVTERHDE